jgi:multidrug efflux pump subunit AcrA (membrane-fusion protein)
LSRTHESIRFALRPLSRRTLVVVAILDTALAFGFSSWWLQGGTAADPNMATATRDDLIVSVGGVGRIVLATASNQIAVPASAGGSTTSAPADAIFPRSSGRVAHFLVEPGQKVKAGQALAVLDDGGAAADAIRQALTAAGLEISDTPEGTRWQPAGTAAPASG